MSLLKKAGKKVEEVAPIVLQQTPEYAAVEESVDNKISEKVETKEVVEDEASYIDTLLASYNERLDDAGSEIVKLQQRLDEARKYIVVLNAVKKNHIVFDVKWLLNRIGELEKDTSFDEHEKFIRLRDEVFDFVEKELKNKDKIK